jgi:hypothetical protein
VADKTNQHIERVLPPEDHDPNDFSVLPRAERVPGRFSVLPPEGHDPNDFSVLPRADHDPAKFSVLPPEDHDPNDFSVLPRTEHRRVRNKLRRTQ